MLSDRFKLVMHRGKKEVSALELVVSKGGPKLALAGSEVRLTVLIRYGKIHVPFS